ncbi:MAG: DUF4954 family protein, partial [Muribaculaceae bacterium]|nr:DUF4954 family protein [Muribaculaceae bacterium]
PYTIGLVLKAMATIKSLLSRESEGNQILYNGITLNRSSLEKGLNIYTLGIYEYLHLRLGDNMDAAKLNDSGVADQWYNIGGQVVAYTTLQSAMEAKSINEIEEIFDKAHTNYRQDELSWIASNFKEWTNKDNIYLKKSSEFDSLVEADRLKSLSDISLEHDMLSI